MRANVRLLFIHIQFIGFRGYIDFCFRESFLIYTYRHIEFRVWVLGFV